MLTNHSGHRAVENPPPDCNRLLESLLVMTPEAIGNHFELVLHRSRRAVREIRGKPGWVHFPVRGALSVLRNAGRADGIEVALVGRRDMTGFPWQADKDSWREISFIPHDGARSLRIRTDRLEVLLDETPGAPQRMSRYLGESWLKLAINLSCLRNHAIDKRLARWLVHMLDHYPGREVKVTQQLLAQLLGVRRGSISAAAGSLQDCGIIRYSRGVIRVVSRQALAEAACDCCRTHREIGTEKMGASVVGAKLVQMGEKS